MDFEQENYLIGRQPILDRTEKVIGYELLFRSSTSRTKAVFSDITHASASVILNTLSDFEQIIGNNKAFINLDLKMIMGEPVELLPKNRVVLELLESTELTPDLIKRCRDLKELGFVLALDDHAFNPLYKELYEIVEIVKIDLLQTPLDSLHEMVQLFRDYPVTLLAEKVESQNVFLQCHKLGIEYFQGYHFAKPSLMKIRRIEEANSTLASLIRLLIANSDIEEIEKTFCTSPGLSNKLLLLVNSISAGFKERVETVRHAITLLGRERLRRWVQLALFVSQNEPVSENRSSGLPASGTL